jgi:hypothetical protein
LIFEVDLDGVGSEAGVAEPLEALGQVAAAL